MCLKLDELSVLLVENSVDIAVITETWLHADILDDVIHIPGYMFYRRDHCDGRKGGGIVVYVRLGLPVLFIRNMLIPR